MFTPSNCNDPDNIQAIKDELMKLRHPNLNYYSTNGANFEE